VNEAKNAESSLDLALQRDPAFCQLADLIFSSLDIRQSHESNQTILEDKEIIRRLLLRESLDDE